MKFSAFFNEILLKQIASSSIQEFINILLNSFVCPKVCIKSLNLSMQKRLIILITIKSIEFEMKSNELS